MYRLKTHTINNTNKLLSLTCVDLSSANIDSYTLLMVQPTVYPGLLKRPEPVNFFRKTQVKPVIKYKFIN